ncbi:MATE family efflux transporter [Motiliproteus sediminis]|uniref:MATE family efflux transporter n=1 Tax=Motiliproteus sediminis TaxID=1468178 RepID=UPI001FE69C9B|nr:MATE family efflux transporter [Motiliproteus sediminis]
MFFHLPTQRVKAILSLALPIIGGMLSQSLLNLVDTAMVGRLGEESLAGVGVGGYANFMVVALILGLSSGVQAMVARRHGEQRLSEKAIPLNGGLVIALLIALPLTLFGLLFSHHIVALISTDQKVLSVADPYFDYRMYAVLAVGLNVCFRGYWNGINQSLVYLRVLVMMHLFNIAISYGLIFGAFGLPELGAPGAGLGTSIALYAGSALYALLTLRQARSRGFLRSMPSRDTLHGMLRLSIPNSLQQFMFAASVTVLLWIIARIGTQELAVAHVLIHLALLLILPAVGLGMAATTLVSHALGENRPDKASRLGWDVVKVALAILVTLSLPLWFFPEAILGLFLHDPALVALAVVPLQITCIAICADTAAIVFTQALLGAGANRTVMLVTTIGQWCFYLPLAWLAGPYLGGGLLGIWMVQLLHRAASSVVFSLLWSRQRWTRITL